MTFLTRVVMNDKGRTTDPERLEVESRGASPDDGVQEQYCNVTATTQKERDRYARFRSEDKARRRIPSEKYRRHRIHDSRYRYNRKPRTGSLLDEIE